MPIYAIDIDYLTEEDIDNNLIIEKFDGLKGYAAVNYRYPGNEKNPEGVIRPFCLIIDNLILPNNCVPSYNKFMTGEYNAQRMVFKMNISNFKQSKNEKIEHIYKICSKIDEKLMKFGKKESNNASYNEKQEFAGICKKPTNQSATNYKKNHPEETRTANQILKDANTLNTYVLFKYKLPLDSDNKTISVFDKDTSISSNDLSLTKDENVDFDINQPYTLDFLDQITKKGNNITMMIKISSWYSMAKYYGYKTFIKSIQIHSINDDNDNEVYCYKGKTATIIKSDKKVKKEDKEDDENKDDEKEDEKKDDKNNKIKTEKVKKDDKKNKSSDEEDENNESDDNEEPPEVDENESEEEEKEEKPKSKTQSKVKKESPKKTTKKQSKKSEKEDSDLEDD